MYAQSQMQRLKSDPCLLSLTACVLGFQQGKYCTLYKSAASLYYIWAFYVNIGRGMITSWFLTTFE